MDGKIIQIIPAPKNLHAVYNMDCEEESIPILCLALTDLGEILIMDTDSCGEVCEAVKEANFLYLDWK